MSTRIKGFDISYAQGHIDWAKFAADPNCQFVNMRATSAQGGLHQDTFYNINLAMARTHKKPLGSYHFGWGVQSPETEAAFYVAHNQRRNGEVQMLDFESRLETIKDPVEWALLWLNKVHSLTNNRPLLYVNQATLDAHNWHVVLGANYGLWVARWGKVEPDPSPWPFWAAWQNSDNGTAQGIVGPVDTDIFNGSVDQWLKYGANG